MKLEPPVSHHLNAAQGWLGLGNADEANAELAKIPVSLQKHPEVLEVRWQTRAKARQWEECVQIAEEFIDLAPKQAWGWVHRSYALHELKRTQEAYDELLPAVAFFPKDWLIQYNLACYSCRLGQHERAMRFLQQAFKLGDEKEIKPMALTDADLRELWEQIVGM
ncbi:MAG TPA: tetratricopeptide repeat protein [Verrucomicrobiae bacterium]|nr:tetratricopeptide repeat protein [Verrucomicrobiae bacterium]